MASLPCLPTLDPIVLEQPFGFDATFDARPPAPPGNHASEAKSTPGNSRTPSVRKVSFVRNETSSELGGDAAIPEPVPTPEPVSVPEAVMEPASTEVPEVITQEVAPEQVVTTVPAAEETVINEVPAENPTVENVEVVQVPPPSPGIQKSTTVVITVPAEEAVEEPGDVVREDAAPLRRRPTTITVTVEAEPAPPSRKSSLPAPRTAFVAAEPAEPQFEGPRKTETMRTVNLEGGTSVTVTEAAPSVEQLGPDPFKPAKKVRIVKTKVTRVRVMSLWRRILAKILRKRAEKKIQETTQIDGAQSPQAAGENATGSLLRCPSVDQPEPGDGSGACERHAGQSSRIGVDQYFRHNRSFQSDVKSQSNAEVRREEPRAVVPCGS
ncbi:hypothetical protein IWX90DRAFT_133734 [Phyllosticta citrichinensis]|uniref:Uncharacterized protein n=1 Tax=Phyllosticta citrichinensis TaxID=1130410 RepID=A0ABR1Y4P9_9PEZI